MRNGVRQVTVNACSITRWPRRLPSATTSTRLLQGHRYTLPAMESTYALAGALAFIFAALLLVVWLASQRSGAAVWTVVPAQCAVAVIPLAVAIWLASLADLEAFASWAEGDPPSLVTLVDARRTMVRGALATTATLLTAALLLVLRAGSQARARRSKRRPAPPRNAPTVISAVLVAAMVVPFAAVTAGHEHEAIADAFGALWVIDETLASAPLATPGEYQSRVHDKLTRAASHAPLLIVIAVIVSLGGALTAPVQPPAPSVRVVAGAVLVIALGLTSFLTHRSVQLHRVMVARIKGYLIETRPRPARETPLRNGRIVNRDMPTAEPLPKHTARGLEYGHTSTKEITVEDPALTRRDCLRLLDRYRSRSHDRVVVRKPKPITGDLQPWCIDNKDGAGVQFASGFGDTAEDDLTEAQVVGMFQEPSRVGEDGVVAPVLVRQIRPRYPETAKASRVEGVVILEAVVGRDGRVKGVEVLRGHALLEQAAIDSVEKWRFRPATKYGVEVDVYFTLTLDFTLR